MVSISPILLNKKLKHALESHLFKLRCDSALLAETKKMYFNHQVFVCITFSSCNCFFLVIHQRRQKYTEKKIKKTQKLRTHVDRLSIYLASLVNVWIFKKQRFRDLTAESIDSNLCFIYIHLINCDTCAQKKISIHTNHIFQITNLMKWLFSTSSTKAANMCFFMYPELADITFGSVNAILHISSRRINTSSHAILNMKYVTTTKLRSKRHSRLILYDTCLWGTILALCVSRATVWKYFDKAIMDTHPI